MSPDSVVIPLDYRVSDSNAMLTRDLVPIVDMRTLRLKSRHICNVMLRMFRYFSEYTSLRTTIYLIFIQAYNIYYII